MVAVNTPPSPSTLMASTRPVVTVNPISTAGSGSNGAADGCGLTFALRSPGTSVVTSSLRGVTDERGVLLLEVHFVEQAMEERIPDRIVLSELEQCVSLGVERARGHLRDGCWLG